jgi:hypothetical protein
MTAISSTYFAVSEMMPSLSTKAKTKRNKHGKSLLPETQLMAAKTLLMWVQPER